MRLTMEELKAAHNNVMAVMENHIMMIARCDRKTANLIANEVLDLDRDADELLAEKTPLKVGSFVKIMKEVTIDTLGANNKIEKSILYPVGTICRVVEYDKNDNYESFKVVALDDNYLNSGWWYAEEDLEQVFIK